MCLLKQKHECGYNITDCVHILAESSCSTSTKIMKKDRKM